MSAQGSGSAPHLVMASKYPTPCWREGDVMKVVELRPDLDCNDIAKTLRNIADDIEAGAYDFAPTMAVVVLGRETKRRSRDDLALSFDWQTHGLGDCGIFAAKGLLASAMASFDGGTKI